MIFWNGSKIYNIIRDGALIEGIYFDYARHAPNFYQGFGRGFTRHFAWVFKSSIVIYDRLPLYRKYPLPIDRIPIVSEYATEFPERFALRTKNIDLLRDLVARGKKITWITPDVYTQAAYLGVFGFEHTLIDPYINTHVIYPTGEVAEAETVKCTHGMWRFKYAKRIGFNTGHIVNRINWGGYHRSRWHKKLKKNKDAFGRRMAVNLYNIFSLTYIVWQQSKLGATTAKKKTARKD